MIQQSPTERAGPVCLCCCRRLSEHNAKRQCPETTYFVASQAAQPAEADGWVMVPRIMTDAMLAAAASAVGDERLPGYDADAAQFWAAALAATPNAPAPAIQPGDPLDGAHHALAGDDAARLNDWIKDELAAEALATPPAPNDDLRAALEAQGERLIAELADAENAGDDEAEEAWHGGAAHGARRMLDIALTALKENRCG